MTINVAEALDGDTAILATITRYAADSVTNGLHTAGAVTTFKAMISPQQPTPRMLEVLDEGERGSGAMLFICNKKLRMASEFNNTRADEIPYDGLVYKVAHLGNWFQFGHTQALGVAVKKVSP